MSNNLKVVVSDWNLDFVESLRYDVHRLIGRNIIVDLVIPEFFDGIPRLDICSKLNSDPNGYGLILMDDFESTPNSDSNGLSNLSIGIDSVKDIRAQKFDIPIAMLGYDKFDIEKRALEAGVTAYFNRLNLFSGVYMEVISELYQGACINKLNKRTI